ncbi:MAG TPA: CinA family nicotinamide mononucleotide deamidase-related protein [Roseiflexaceae bacterium]|nr:CinA family nicotinamide mononucleotide deamidase-related protein [Roseiflexaceae bacterium]
MNAEIIAIGSELLLGETVDTNSAYLARQLAAAGINLFRKSVVGDNEERIAALISEALDRADLLVCTGGLGPTVDDMTREAVARAVGRPLVFHQHLLDQIEARFRSFGRMMSESNRRQAYVPAGARIVENPRGTAPAFIVEDARGVVGRTVVVLPGVPSEMRFLWETAILPYLRDVRGETGVILVRTVYAAGLGESVIGELIADLMAQENPTVGISAKQAQYELRIGARADNRATAEALADEAEAELRRRLGEHIVGGEPLGAAVVRLLAERGLTLALYEGTAHAPVYRALSAAPGGAGRISGAILHPLDEPADDEAAMSLARTSAFSARDRWRTALALAVQPASAPAADGFTTVALALVHAGGVVEAARRIDMRSDDGWAFVGTAALDMLRQHLLASAPRAIREGSGEGQALP